MAQQASPPPRIVTLVLVTPGGRPVGVLPPFEVSVPWWQQTGPVVQGARERFGLDITVLRLLAAERHVSRGGSVTYLAEAEAPAPDLEPWAGTLDEHPLRATWARPGGPDAELAWATAVMADRGIEAHGRPEQVRSWNLSSLWRLPTSGGACWLKVVPPFLAHEGRLLERLQGGAVPNVLAVDGPRILMAELSGEDLYEAKGATLRLMVSQVVGLQQAWLGRTEELMDLGLPDWRGPALTAAIADVVERVGPQLQPAVQSRLDRFVDDLNRRFTTIDACGLPDTLVHGDFHPGNHRGDSERVVLLDWGDSGVGHPLLDQPAFLERVAEPDVAKVRDHWHRAWREAVPGSDPDRASALLAPIAAARQAVIYLHFLDHIEPSEHPYHAADPADWLGRTAALL